MLLLASISRLPRTFYLPTNAFSGSGAPVASAARDLLLHDYWFSHSVFEKYYIQRVFSTKAQSYIKLYSKIYSNVESKLRLGFYFEVVELIL